MTRESALILTLAVAVLLIGLMGLGWWRRSRRDGALVAPFGELPTGAAVLAAFPGLYVATTAHGDPLNRLAVKGLAFRSRGSVLVTDAGISLDLAGTQRVFVPRDRIVAVAQATVAIDRVVERDGLTRLTWHISDDTVVDSYFRPQDASARALAAAIEPLVPTEAPTGTDA